MDDSLPRVPPDPLSGRAQSAGDRVSSGDEIGRTALASIFAHIPATVWMTDDQLSLTFVHGVLLRQLGVSPDRVLGRTLQDLLLDGRDDHPLIQGHLTALSGHETTVRIEWGGDIHSARIGPRRDADGRVVGCIGVQQVIGWLPEDDLTVRESEIRLQRVIDWNIVGIAFGDDQGRITDANDMFLRLTGYAREDLVPDGLSWPSLTAVEFHQRQIEAIHQILASGRCAPFETEIIRRDGQRLSVLVSAARLSARRREGVAFVMDISRFKHVERGLRAELAVADALGEAPDTTAGLMLVAERLTDLGWLGASLWCQHDPDMDLCASHGAAPVDSRVLAQIVARAGASGEPVWIEPARTVVMPLMAQRQCLGALALVWPAGQMPGDDCIGTTGAIARRVARFLQRRGARA